MSKNDSVFEPLELPPEAIYEPLHFTHWGMNLLREKIHGLNRLPMPKLMPLICITTGEVRMVPTSRDYKDKVVAAIKEMMERES